MRRGEIWVAAASGYAGKPRPVLVVQDKGFDTYESVVIALVTSYNSDDLPYRLRVEPSEGNGLAKTSWVMVDKLIAIPNSAFSERIGVLEPDVMKRVSAALADFLGL